MKVYLLLALVAMGATVISTPLVRWVAIRFKILPKLRERDVMATPLPRIGGVAMTFAFIFTMLLAKKIPYMAAVYHSPIPMTVAISAAAMSVLGVIDDVLELEWYAKMAGQILITAYMASRGVQLVTLPIFGLTVGSARLSLVLTVLVVVAIINAVNFIDGLDGLAAGLVAIGSFGFFVYSYTLTRILGSRTYATSASLIVAILLGVCLGFLWFNFRPASILMGGGAETLGLILSASAITVTGKIDPGVLAGRQVFIGMLPILLPVAILIIPIGDLVITSVRRMLRGKSPFHADRLHFHDSLLRRGHSHRGVVIILYLWTILVCFTAVGLLLLDWRAVILPTCGISVFLAILTVWEFPPREQKKRLWLFRGHLFGHSMSQDQTALGEKQINSGTDDVRR